MPLPQDYKSLVDVYGVGSFADWIKIYSPFAPQSASNFFEMSDSVLGLYRECMAYRPDDVPPFPPFPQPGGLLPWAGDENSCAFCWITQGLPDDWIVVNLDQHYTLEDHRVLDYTVAELLAGWFAGRITGDWYPDDIHPVEMRYFSQHLK